jgi:hypothetical protein
MIPKFLVALMASILVVVMCFRNLSLEAEINEFAVVLFCTIFPAFLMSINYINNWLTKGNIEHINYYQSRILSGLLNTYIAPIVTAEDKDKLVQAILVDWDEKKQETIVLISSENCDSYIPLKDVNQNSVKKAIGLLTDDEYNLKNQMTKKWNEEDRF